MSVGHFQMPDFPRKGKGLLPMKISERMCCGVQKPTHAFCPRFIHMHSIPRATSVWGTQYCTHLVPHSVSTHAVSAVHNYTVSTGTSLWVTSEQGEPILFFPVPFLLQCRLLLVLKASVLEAQGTGSKGLPRVQCTLVLLNRVSCARPCKFISTVLVLLYQCHSSWFLTM